MPLTKASLSTRIKAAIDALFDIEDSEILQEFSDAVAQAIVDEIQAHALVTGTVTSGAGSGGVVTGTVS